MSSEENKQRYRNEREVLNDIQSGNLTAEDAVSQLAERRRWNRRRVHMRTSKGLVQCQNLFGPRGPSSLTFSRAQWEKHVRFVNSGTMEKFFEKNDEYLYNRERDGEYSNSKFAKRRQRTKESTESTSE